ncbi:hypothetical protein EGR_09896 [Echinococcus granulosus]|uniref:Uncharacterized protein n=1 Tax=Echinococcus granulosus TaxID=6210 RepID=W6U2E1_ECHGR|nr:hypothetical protein EGR_09896 [Echinococcus granulosus]EUB55233.1 hypothetical protein EGR_09896 [Echinococcus granulosus]
MESDPAVTSTVNESDLSYSDSPSEKTEVSVSAKPHWRFCSVQTANPPHFSESETPPTSVHEFEIPELEFDDEIPDLEGDLGNQLLLVLHTLSLPSCVPYLLLNCHSLKRSSLSCSLRIPIIFILSACHPFWDMEYDDEFDVPMTPDGLIDEDFERELGWYEKWLDWPESSFNRCLGDQLSSETLVANLELSIQEVIDSEFRDISRLGIIQVGVSDHDGRSVFAFFTCRLPHTELIDHDRFFKKNLKSLIIVYPTRTVRVLWNLFSAFIRQSKVNRDYSVWVANYIYFFTSPLAPTTMSTLTSASMDDA